MKFYNNDLRKKLSKAMYDALRKNFNNGFGVSDIIFNMVGDVETVVVDRVKGSGTKEIWTHYATISKTAKGWEVSESFVEIDEDFCNKWGDEYRQWIGTKQTAVYIYGYYQTFWLAARSLKSKGNSENKRLAIEVYV